VGLPYARAVTTITSATLIDALSSEVVVSGATLARPAARLRRLLGRPSSLAGSSTAISRAPLEGLLAAFDLAESAFDRGVAAAAETFATSCRRATGTLYAFAVVAGGTAFAATLLRRVPAARDDEPGAASFFDRAAAEVGDLLARHEVVLAHLDMVAPSSAVERAREGARAQWWRLRAMQSGLAFLAAAREAAALEAGADVLVSAWEVRPVVDAGVVDSN
jgi:hypothetical protein